MSLVEPAFIGIDPTSGRTSFTYAVLDKELRLVTLADGEMSDVISLLAGQKSATIAINAPSALNRGLVAKKMKAEMDGQHQLRGAQMRLAEYELRKRGIAVSGTPSTLDACPSWIQAGFDLYRGLEEIGFARISEKGLPLQMLETHPHACYCVLTETIPQPRPMLEGRLQRQLALFENGVRIQDAMDFFEEITRHKMLKGLWPKDLLYAAEQLDALAAAFMAWLATNKPGQVCSVGDAKEGKIFLPRKELKEKY